MPIESIFVLNDIEKQMAENLILRMDSGAIPAKRKTTDTNDIHSEISYQYSSTKQEKNLCGLMLDCQYKLRYRNSNRIFFSAWNCKDVCSVFYDVITITHMMAQLDYNVHKMYQPFEVDLNLEGYVFFTGQIARSLLDITDYLNDCNGKVSHNSQYIASVFREQECGVYDVLIAKLKADDYSLVQILQVWIRGEILYYAIADGVVLRPRYQRNLTSKEEADLIRKIHKTTNDLSRTVDFT
ncbi:MAG: hypothetical protein LBD93_08235 [Treponema sp.]|jgi:hypothetical protein|nr:hypothetical protein [Treponema sp.]